MREAAIQTENTHGPVLTISGEDDEIWQSTRMAGAVAARLQQAHFPYQFEYLKYPHAGHRADHPAIVPDWQGKVRHPVSGREIDWGGTPEGDALSSIDAIPKVLNFLRQNLENRTPER
jgi:hypothetical protein